VNDPLRYAFGNEADGWYYAGSSWMKGFAMLAGLPGSEPLASQPQTLPRAFRDNLANILGTMRADGRTRFGYNFNGEYVDDNLHTVIGAYAYLVYSGDIAFIRQQLPAMERLIDGFLRRRNADGLYDGGVPQHWYYDAMPSSGVNTYHNTFFCKALLDLAEMERAADDPVKADRYASIAAGVKDAINRVLWYEDAPDGPRYCDWITPQGEKVTYAADLCQWPPLALGVASPEQAKKLIATLDRRIAVLERDFGYAGYATLSAYWPVPAAINKHPINQGYGNYMNGGTFLGQTYWEIVGRARAGDADGAWRRLKKFSEGATRDGWCGNNWNTQKGEIGPYAVDEPYLSDMVVVPAALIQGLLGVRPSWEKLDVQPSLPAAWHEAAADIVWKGRRQQIRIRDGRITIEAGKIVYEPPRQLAWGISAAQPPEWDIAVERTFTTGNGWTTSGSIDLRDGQCIRLKTIAKSPSSDGQSESTSSDRTNPADTQQPSRNAPTGAYQSEICDWGQPVRLREFAVNGQFLKGQVSIVVEASSDNFATVPRTFRVDLQEGKERYSLADFASEARATRVRVELHSLSEPAAAPVVTGFHIFALAPFGK